MRQDEINRPIVANKERMRPKKIARFVLDALNLKVFGAGFW
jgi:hypothetical protein